MTLLSKFLLFNQVYFLSESHFWYLEVFFPAGFMFLTEFSEEDASEFSQRGLALV